MEPHASRVEVKGPVEDDAPIATYGVKISIALWLPTKQIEHNEAPHRQAHERPCGGIIISAKFFKIVISIIGGRNARAEKFGSSGGVRGTPLRCYERIVVRGGGGGER